MCNLYSIGKTRDELRNVFRARVGSGPIGPALPAGVIPGPTPPLGEIFPDALAPIIRMDAQGNRELLDMRWGFPPPSKQAARPVTNVRNLASNYWRGWLKPEWRCLVPVTEFCEWSDTRPKTKRWFRTEAAQPFAFAGIWRPWRGTRGTKKAPVEGEHLLYAFLTTEADEVVRPMHSKAMPVILADEEAWDQWLTGSIEEAVAMQRPAGVATIGMTG